jgi:hypothetical protein
MWVSVERPSGKIQAQERGENILGWYHLAITSMNEKGTKNSQIIFLGLLL